MGVVPEDTFKSDIEEDDRVEVVVPMGRYEARLPAQQDAAPRFMEGTVFGEDPEIVGLTSLEGRHPVFEDEISLGLIKVSMNWERVSEFGQKV